MRVPVVIRRAEVAAGRIDQVAGAEDAERVPHGVQ